MNFHLLVHNFWQYTIGGLTAGAIYALVALGYTLVYGVLRLINFAHSEIFMLGTMGSLWATHWLHIGEAAAAKTGILLIGTLVACLAVSMVISGGAAVILERVAYRPLRKRGSPRLTFLISAIGASLAISEGVRLRFGLGPFRFPRLLHRSTLFHFLGTAIRIDQVLVIASAIVMMIALDQFVSRTRTGRGIRALSQDAETAVLLGVNVDRVVAFTFLLGGLMAGGAGMLFILFYESTTATVGFLLGIKAFTAAVLGGIGNLRGALLGGLLLGLIENYGGGLFGGKWQDPVAFAVLVLVLLIRPSGILGEKLGRARV